MSFSLTLFVHYTVPLPSLFTMFFFWFSVKTISTVQAQLLSFIHYARSFTFEKERKKQKENRERNRQKLILPSSSQRSIFSIRRCGAVAWCEEDHFREVHEQISTVQENVQNIERMLGNLEKDEKSLEGKIEKRRNELERSEKRLSTLQSVRPAYMDEYTRLQAGEVAAISLFSSLFSRFCFRFARHHLQRAAHYQGNIPRPNSSGAPPTFLKTFLLKKLS